MSLAGREKRRGTIAAYYNENDKPTAAWLRELIRRGLIAPGDVDERSIKDVKADDVKGYTQCHFFAGIGGWSYALRLAGVPDEAPVWTGSCPCQPFSCNGKKKAFDDDRHLWPALFRIIGQRRPAVVFGEQVADAIADGWLDLVFDDLESIDYACASTVLPACSVGAPHRRYRAWWVAESEGSRGRWRKSLASWDREAIRGSMSHLCAESWPDGRGSGSTLSVADVLSPSHGVRGRVGLLKGFGNAIVPQVAAEFVESYLDAVGE